VLGFRLEQTLDIVPDRGFHRSRPLAEVAAEALAEVQESLTDPGQQPYLGIGGRVFVTASEGVSFMFSVMFAFIGPCLLIRVVLSLIIKKNQIHESDKVEINKNITKSSEGDSRCLSLKLLNLYGSIPRSLLRSLVTQYPAACCGVVYRVGLRSGTTRLRPDQGVACHSRRQRLMHRDLSTATTANPILLTETA
jgi:hypothetical protein